jgi:hypothetical protein
MFHSKKVLVLKPSLSRLELTQLYIWKLVTRPIRRVPRLCDVHATSGNIIVGDAKADSGGRKS